MYHRTDTSPYDVRSTTEEEKKDHETHSEAKSVINFTPSIDGEDSQIQGKRFITSLGEDMSEWAWDAGDADEEVQELVPLKTPYEIKHNVHFSLNGMKAFIN